MFLFYFHLRQILKDYITVTHVNFFKIAYIRMSKKIVALIVISATFYLKAKNQTDLLSDLVLTFLTMSCILGHIQLKTLIQIPFHF